MDVLKVCKVCNKTSWHTGTASFTCMGCLNAGLKFCNICHSSLRLEEFGKGKSLCKKCHSKKSSACTSLRYHSDEDFRQRAIAFNVKNKKDRYIIDEEFRDKYKHANKLNKVRRRGALLAHTITDWLCCLEHFNNKCVYCGSSAELTKDHIVPISQGGSNSISNIVPACSTCNKRKGIKNAKEFASVESYSVINKWMEGESNAG